jgi:hypothetical protein
VKPNVILSGAVVFSAAVLGSACRQETATLTPETNLRAFVESSRRAQPPETRAAAKVDLSAAETETMNPDKHEYTVDPSVEYSDLTIRLRPFTQLKGKILNLPAK